MYPFARGSFRKFQFGTLAQGRAHVTRMENFSLALRRLSAQKKKKKKMGWVKN